MSFSALGLSEKILEGVKAMGYVEPTPIQLARHPARACRQATSSAARRPAPAKRRRSPCPSFPSSAHTNRGPRVLILEPTRELAAQVETAFRDYARFTNLKTTVVLRRRRLRPAERRIARRRGHPRRHARTPARPSGARHVADSTTFNFSCSTKPTGCSTWDFCPTCAGFVDKCPRERHTALFSATIPPQIETLIKWAMHNPETIEIGARRTPAETVKHVIYPVADSQKSDLLLELLERVNYDSVLVFCRTKHGADRIAGLLKRNNHAVAVLHSNRTQREREQALARFSRRQIRGAGRHGHRRARTRHRRRQPRHQLRRAAASGGLHPSHRAHRPRRGQRRRLHHHDRRGRQPRLRHRTLHQPENPARETGKFRLPIHRPLRRKQTRRAERVSPAKPAASASTAATTSRLDGEGKLAKQNCSCGVDSIVWANQIKFLLGAFVK